MSKYSSLKKFLLRSSKQRITLRFKDIENILGALLPDSAYRHRAWWANDARHTQARNGWLAAGYRVEYVDLNREVVAFVKSANTLASLQEETKRSHNEVSNAVSKAREFEELAREVMSRYFGVRLEKRKKEGWPKEFDLVSPDYRIVGDAKYYAMVRGRSIPPAKFSTIAEHVWMLENIDAEVRFLVFGNDRKVPLEWLKRYGKMVKTVRFFFIDSRGNLEELP